MEIAVTCACLRRKEVTSAHVQQEWCLNLMGKTAIMVREYDWLWYSAYSTCFLIFFLKIVFRSEKYRKEIFMNILKISGHEFSCDFLTITSFFRFFLET